VGKGRLGKGKSEAERADGDAQLSTGDHKRDRAIGRRAQGGSGVAARLRALVRRGAISAELTPIRKPLAEHAPGG